MLGVSDQSTGKCLTRTFIVHISVHANVLVTFDYSEKSDSVNKRAGSRRTYWPGGWESMNGANSEDKGDEVEKLHDDEGAVPWNSATRALLYRLEFRVMNSAKFYVDRPKRFGSRGSLRIEAVDDICHHGSQMVLEKNVQSVASMFRQ
jgi:hypothetical protein